MVIGRAPLATEILCHVSLDVLEDDPYPIYEQMRRECPIAFVPDTGRVLWRTTGR